MNFHSASPILRVEDMARSLAFYRDVLGFTPAPWGDQDFTAIDRGDACIYLCRRGQGRGEAWIWIGVADVDRLRDEIVGRGGAIRMEPTSRPWARELHVEDPDGNVIRFGSDPTSTN